MFVWSELLKLLFIPYFSIQKATVYAVCWKQMFQINLSHKLLIIPAQLIIKYCLKVKKIS